MVSDIEHWTSSVSFPRESTNLSIDVKGCTPEGTLITTEVFFDWSLLIVVVGYGAAMWPVSKLVVTSHGASS